MIDKSNRWRQRILAMEERFVTKSWPFRYFTTVLGFIFINTFSANEHYNNLRTFVLLRWRWASSSLI